MWIDYNRLGIRHRKFRTMRTHAHIRPHARASPVGQTPAAVPTLTEWGGASLPAFAAGLATHSLRNENLPE